MKYLFYYICILCLVNALPSYLDTLQEELYRPMTGRVQTYYIAVEEVVWDYSSHHILGTKYLKSLYVEYTDVTFREKKPRPKWQGNMGPILRAEVGDLIRIHFWNKAHINCTMHPHGVFYDMEMEGALFKGGYEKAVVHYNETYTYEWHVHPRAGPGPKDGNSLVWGYHSHVTEGDIYAGLYGAIVVYRPGKLEYSERVFTFLAHDENHSPYLPQTLATWVDKKLDLDTLSKDELEKANLFLAINGLIKSSPSDLILHPNSMWHLIGWGSFRDNQQVKWENELIDLNGRQVDHVRLLPASFYTVYTSKSRKGRHKFGLLDQEDSEMVMYYNVTF
ncbi:Cupredoxin [Pilobolus umbonatus]|nr:Cupredoxin [Pilobolus umbonatus]